jgi:hypothetical protein
MFEGDSIWLGEVIIYTADQLFLRAFQLPSDHANDWLEHATSMHCSIYKQPD